MAFTGTFIYLHGFRSSPLSVKAKLVSDKLAEMSTKFCGELYIPDLGFDIEKAIEQVENKLRSSPPPFVFMGSSLGGYHATYLVEKSEVVLNRSPKAKVVLINPSVKPFELLTQYLGWVDNLYTGEKFEVKLEHTQMLRKYYIEQITHPERYFLLTKSKDEILDYWQAVTHYQGCHAMIEAGGNHAFEDLEVYLDQVLAFLEVS